MPVTYENIATTTLGSAASTITFSSISGSFTDLRLVLIGTTSVDYTNILFRFNSDSGTNYSQTRLRGNGTSAVSSRETTRAQIVPFFNGMRSSIPTFCAIDIFSYAGSTNKTCLIEASEDHNNSGFDAVCRDVGLWRNTAAITAVSFTASGANFNSGTTATLYGITKF